MARVFKLYPETGRAKESFEDAVRQAEDQLNIRKADLLRLRSEISKLKAERETLAKAIAAAAPPEVPVSSPTASVAPAAPAVPAPSAPAPSAQASTAAALGGRPLASAPKGLLQLPGFYASTGTIAAPSAGEKAQPSTPALAVSSPSASQPPMAAAAPSQPSAPPAELLALAELDEKLARKTADLAQKEEEFKAVQASAEKNLLELESRKTDLLLGKIHRAVQDVARREGISVVVDKTGILYGQDAVDLTEKVLQTLRGG